MDWKLEDYTNGKKGFLRITCDGERIADAFPYAPGSDPEVVTDRCRRMVETMNGFRDGGGEDDYFVCEGCGNPIRPGDKYTTTLDGCYLCEEDAPSFQDCVDHWDGRGASSDMSDDEEESAASCRSALAQHVAAGGSPDDKPLTVME